MEGHGAAGFADPSEATWTCPTGSSSVDSTELGLRTKFQVPALPLANGVTPRGSASSLTFSPAPEKRG